MHGVRAVSLSCCVVSAHSSTISRETDVKTFVAQRSFTRANIDSIPNSVFGIYALWYRDRCIYVGQATKQPVGKRLMQHWYGSHNSRLAGWIRAKGNKLNFNYTRMDDPEQIDTVEELCISQFQPLTNFQHKGA